jgi:formylglycine-generating enzyme required for sulfatase activity
VTGPKVEIAAAEFTPPGSVVNEPWAAPALWANRAVVAKVWKNDDFNEMWIRCAGDHVIVNVNGVPVVDAPFPKMPGEGIIAWQLHGGVPPEEIVFREIQFADLSRGDAPLSAAQTTSPNAAPDDDRFVPLFNGKDLAGWKTHPKEPGNWRVEDGAIVGSGPARSHLYSERGDFADFHLRVEANVNDGGNSGVWFRSSYGPVWPSNAPAWSLGCEAQISSRPPPESPTGSLYIADGQPGSGKPAVSFSEQLARPNEWFTLEVIARDNHFVIKVNDRTTVDYVDEQRRFQRGHLALQQHTPETVIKFRKIEIREFTEDDGEPKVGKTKTKTVPGSKTSPKSPKSKKPSSKIGAKAGPLEGKKPGDERDDNGLGMRLVWCPPGEFQMGSPKTDNDAFRDEHPQVRVTLTKGFWLAKTELTQAEWQQIMGTAPWKKKAGTKEAPDCPATFVSWSDALAFCRALTEQERRAGRLPDGWEYTLPTEAQWEYACRAGTTTRYSFGDDAVRLSDFGWFDKNTGVAGEKFAHSVGAKKPNPWGLVDMHGNVWEWCRDTYSGHPPGGTDPEVSSADSKRLFRGGSWRKGADDCRSANRHSERPSYTYSGVGFRVALARSGSE